MHVFSDSADILIKCTNTALDISKINKIVSDIAKTRLLYQII